MKIYKNMANLAGIAIEILYYHMNTNGVVFHADSTYSKENKSYLRYKEKK